MNDIVISITSMVGLGVFFAVVLAVADRTMSVKEDKRIAYILEILPGLNCGACGYSGCSAFAENLAKGNVPVTGCLPGGEEAAAKLSALLGMEKGETVKSTAVVHCNADFDKRTRHAVYKGINTCRAAVRILGGGVACAYGCVGYGDCAVACPFGAITMANGLPVVDSTKCTSCGKCVSACPRKLFTVEKFMNSQIVTVACSSRDKGPIVKRVCGIGCIGCRICEKISGGVFSVSDNLARPDYKKADKGTDWNGPIEKCPTKVIAKIT